MIKKKINCYILKILQQEMIYFIMLMENVKQLVFLFLFPERFEPNQLVYIDGNVNVYENDIIRYIDEDGEDTDFETIVREFGEVELIDGYVDFDLTFIKYINEMGLGFFVAGNVYEVKDELC